MSNRLAWTATHVAFHEYLVAAEGLALRSGPDLYPGVQLALDALPWLGEHAVMVLGFDGLDTDGRWIRPRLDRIADFSRLLDEHSEWNDRVRRSLDESHRLLTAWLGDVQFVDLVIVAEDEIMQLHAQTRRLSSRSRRDAEHQGLNQLRLAASWRRTEADLRYVIAHAALPPNCVRWVTEYLDHNELGLAWERIAWCLQNPTPDVAERMEAARLRMGFFENWT